MRVTIVAYTQEFTLEVGDREPILQIKKKIEQALAIPSSAMTLSIYGLELLDGLDMEDYPIVSDNTKIDLTVNPVSTDLHGKFYIVVKFPSKQTLIQVDQTETVQSLKEKIHIMDGMPVTRLTLYFSGVELEDDFRYLNEYEIREFSEIIVFLKTMIRVRDEPPVRIVSFVVQTSSSLLNAARIPVEMKDSSTVEEMKRLLLGNRILPLDEYLFIHKQRIMRDPCSLRWHGVETGDTLYVFKGTITRTGF